MSKTDKTRPIWVKVLDPLAEGRYERHDHTERWYPVYSETETEVVAHPLISGGVIRRKLLEWKFWDGSCTIDRDVSAYRRPHEPRSAWIGHHCGWTIDYYYSWNHWNYRSPKKIDRKVDYYDPERTHVRNTLRDMAREWNAYGDIENDDATPMSQHRHSTWYGGWWD
jgi:hypothetical protein